MDTKESFREAIFSTREHNFEQRAIELFQYQAVHNLFYGQFLEKLGVSVDSIDSISKIPFLPVEFFKNHTIITEPISSEPIIFRSSGTTGMQFSKHYVYDLPFYHTSSLLTFEQFYGPIEDYIVLALLPAYLDRPDSSLVSMADFFIQNAKPGSGFFNKDLNNVAHAIKLAKSNGQKVFLLGVTFALLDLAEQFPMDLDGHVIMETGGMKGRRKEMIREELHSILTKAFNVQSIHSEYGMTELLSQGYSKGEGIFKTAPWMKIILRDTNDPLTCNENIKSGGVNIIDLANVDSCAFIATQDLGKMYPDGTFEILGRFDHADVRGCNLMYV